MGERQVVPLLYGAGIDRATGVHAVEGRAGRDLRNLYLYRDKVQVRHGMNPVNTLVDEFNQPLSDVVLVQALQAEQVGLVAGFGSDGRVHLFRTGGDGVGLSPIGIAFTLAAGAHSPPRLLATEQYNKVFVAHDEANRSFRAPTVYYDPYGVPALKTLQADLDGAGMADVLFRGVAPYLTYLVGWGFGTASDPDHPEVVRVAHPDDPTLLDPDDYFLAGTGGSPVLNCLPAGVPGTAVSLVMKPTELHRIIGYDKRTFGIEQIESGHGLAASRLAYGLNGVVYFWDPAEGPRRSSGGPSEDLAWPLDLEAPEPADLVAAGALADGFACYLPGRRCLLFVFGKRVYCLSLWDPQAMKWNYWELGVPAQSGGILYTGSDLPTSPPTGAPTTVTLSAPTDTTLHAAWDNAGLTGGEVAELWLHALTADTWKLVAQIATSGGSQSTDLTALVPGTDFKLQVRYRRGPNYRADYSSSDPGDWPAGSLSATEATTIAAPVLTSVEWARTSAIAERSRITWAGSLLVESKVYRSAALIATVPAGTLTYDDATILGEHSYDWTVKQAGDHDSADSNMITAWTGPFPGVTDPVLEVCNGGYYANWSTVNPDAVEVDIGDEAHGTVVLPDIGVVAATFYLSSRPASNPTAFGEIAAVDGGPVPNPVNLGDTIDARIRHYETAFGVDDFSPAEYPKATFNRDPCA